MTIDRMTAAEFRRREGLPIAEDAKPQIRLPKLSGPNKTEAAWMRVCESKHPGCKVMYEPFTLRLPSGTRYTPDVVVTANTCIVAIYETKGAHIHNSASIRAFKEARAAFPMWTFTFAQKTKDGWATT